ncbi:hypothetical protein [uncultured Kordia sp.]|uniref:hypothetical protein n=1 Tax=uncultured Kordia sp. TaxID=507699 RepID=UPI00262EAF40|nr:hypothetical protein [uncultured Kordia sp.]
MKKSKTKLNLKKMSISNLATVKGGRTVWCTITIGGGGNYSAGCPPTEESQCCDTRMDSYCDRET